MKKLFLLFTLAAALTACTSKEQDEKIHAFWGEQTQKAMIKFGPAFAQSMSKAGPLMAAHMSKMQTGAMSDEDFEKMMQEMQNDPEFAKFLEQNKSAQTEPQVQPEGTRPQFMDITMDDEDLSAAEDEEDRQLINDSIREIQQSNQEYISSLSSTQYTDAERAEIMAIFTEEEKQLKEAAAKSTHFISFMKEEIEITQQAHKKLQAFIENKYKMPRSRRSK